MIVQKVENGYSVYETTTSLSPELEEIQTLILNETVTLEMMNIRKAQMQQQVDYCDEIISKIGELE